MRFVRIGAVVACAAAVSALAIELAACSSFSGAELADASGTMETSVEAAPIADAADAADTAPPFPISKLVNVLPGQYSIEATEVTVAEFRDFKSKFGDEAGAPWTNCPHKTALGPGCNPPDSANDAPVVCVDACDAQSYCAAIGRHLCGDISGGPVPRGKEQSTLDDEWTLACAGTSGNPYPYGTTAIAGVCNNAPDSGSGSVANVATFKDCQGGEPGVFDMSGNVWEWENDCSPDGNGGFTCAFRGGSFNDTYESSDCHAILSASSEIVFFTDVGFRCCAKP